MKKTVLTSISITALLALSACGDPVESDDMVVEDPIEDATVLPEEGAMADEGAAMEDGAMEDGAMADDADANGDAEAAMEADAGEGEESGNRISISRDSVSANVDGVSVNAGADGDASLTVE